RDRGRGVDRHADARDIRGPERRTGARLSSLARTLEPRDASCRIGRDPVAEQQIDALLHARVQIATLASAIVVAGRALGIPRADQLGQVAAALHVAGLARLHVEPLALAQVGLDPDALHIQQRERTTVGPRRLAAAGREPLVPALE